MTNIASAISKDPEFVSNVRDVFILGGSYLAIGNVALTAEYNFYSNPEAAEKVFRSFKNITLVPYENIRYVKPMPQEA